MNKEITWIDDQLDNLTDHDLAQLMAESKALENHLKVLKAKITERLTNRMSVVDTLTTPLGKISLAKGSDGKPYVKDPTAYGQWLKDNGSDDYHEAPIPDEDVTKPDALKLIIKQNGGDMPDGVEFRSGRADSLRVTLAKGYENKFTLNAPGALLLTGAQVENPTPITVDNGDGKGPQDPWSLDSWEDIRKGRD